MDVLGWIVNPKKSPPPSLDEAAVGTTERLMQEHARKHQLPAVKGNEDVRDVAQGLRARFDPRLSKTTAELLRTFPAIYSNAKQEGEELNDQLEGRALNLRLTNLFLSQSQRALFGLQLREAYVADRTGTIIAHINALKAAAEATGAVSPELAAVHAGITAAYEKLNQRSADGVVAAAAQRAEGAEDLEDWRAFAALQEERLAAAEARLRQRMETVATDRAATPPVVPPPVTKARG